MENVGLLAGIGTLPGEFLDAAHLQGYRVICIAVIPGTDPELKEKADVYYEISAFKLNKIIKTHAARQIFSFTLNFLSAIPI